MSAFEQAQSGHRRSISSDRRITAGQSKTAAAFCWRNGGGRRASGCDQIAVTQKTSHVSAANPKQRLSFRPSRQIPQGMEGRLTRIAESVALASAGQGTAMSRCTGARSCGRLRAHRRWPLELPVEKGKFVWLADVPCQRIIQPYLDLMKRDAFSSHRCHYLQPILAAPLGGFPDHRKSYRKKKLCAGARGQRGKLAAKNSDTGDRRGYDKASRALILLSSPALNRLLLVGSEVLQIHKAVNRELVGIVLSALGKRCDVRSE